jgi:hypothetical protein
MTKQMLTHDRTSVKEVYATILEYFPNTSAKDWAPEMIFAFIAEGADPVHWQRVLRNYECRPPKPKRKGGRSTGKGPNNRHNSDARRVINRDLVPH